MRARLRQISTRGRCRLAQWTILGTAGCIAVSVAFNWFAFRNFGDAAFRQGLISAVIIPVLLAGPLFFYLTLKLRELAIVNHELRVLASTDHLTGCLNRRAFTRASVEWLHGRGAEECGRGALLIIDADRFKTINDVYGHHHGDEALRLIARSIKSVLRSGDQFGRLGGEEFGVLLPNVTDGHAEEVAERVRIAVGTQEFRPGGEPHGLSVSIGCVCFERPTGYRDLFRLADNNLYLAKSQGRDRIVISGAPSIMPEFPEMRQAG